MVLKFHGQCWALQLVLNIYFLNIQITLNDSYNCLYKIYQHKIYIIIIIFFLPSLFFYPGFQCLAGYGGEGSNCTVMVGSGNTKGALEHWQEEHQNLVLRDLMFMDTLNQHILQISDIFPVVYRQGDMFYYICSNLDMTKGQTYMKLLHGITLRHHNFSRFDFKPKCEINKFIQMHERNYKMLYSFQQHFAELKSYYFNLKCLISLDCVT